jgi:hypothetical protein
MKGKFREIGYMILCFLIPVAAIALFLIFIRGAKWAVDHLLSPIIAVGWGALFIDILILLPYQHSNLYGNLPAQSYLSHLTCLV